MLVIETRSGFSTPKHSCHRNQTRVQHPQTLLSSKSDQDSAPPNTCHRVETVSFSASGQGQESEGLIFEVPVLKLPVQFLPPVLSGYHLRWVSSLFRCGPGICRFFSFPKDFASYFPWPRYTRETCRFSNVRNAEASVLIRERIYYIQVGCSKQFSEAIEVILQHSKAGSKLNHLKYLPAA